VTRYVPQWLQSGSYAASLDRRLIGALWPAPASSGCAVTAVGTGMDVHVDPGQVAVPSANNTGTVLCTSDAIETLTLAPAPPAGTDRVDLVVCHPRSADLGGTTEEDFIFAIVAGAEGAPPGAAPAVPAGTVALAQIHVAGGAASLAAGDITDRRPGSISVPPLYVPPYPPWPRENYTNGYAASGGSLMAQPVRTMSCRAQITTDAAGRANVNVGAACTAAGIAVPTVMIAFQAMSIGVSTQITNDIAYPWPDPTLVPIRAFTVLGANYAATFNILYTAWFNNGP